MQKTYVIGLTTFKEIVRRPMFWMLTIVANLLFLLFCLIPYFTLGEDIKMVKDQGLTVLTVTGLIVALFAASVSIADEIEGKTALTLLSKPVNRREFILGKYFGVMAAILLLFLLLTLVFFPSLYLKAGFEAKENATENPAFEERMLMLGKMAPGVVLAFFQVTLLCALSIAFSTRLPIHWNITLCIAVYLLGNLSKQMVDFSHQQHGAFPAVEFMAKVFAVVLPGLGYFNIGPAISTDAFVPWIAYVLPCLGYCILYTSFALVLAFLLFEDRDLA